MTDNTLYFPFNLAGLKCTRTPIHGNNLKLTGEIEEDLNKIRTHPCT